MENDLQKAIPFLKRAWCCVFLALATCCGSPPATVASLQRYRFADSHMGTLFTITLYAADQAHAEQAARAAFRRVHELDEIMTDYDPDSELLRLCREPYGNPVKVSADLFRILELSQDLSRKSNGAFDVTVGPYVYLWRTTRRTHKLPTEAALANAARAVGHEKLELNARDRTVTLLVPDMRLDLGGIAKGFAADEAMKILRAHDCARALVAASGDIAVGDPPPGEKGWNLGISSIDSGPDRLTRKIQLKNAAVSTSGDTEQFLLIDGVRYSHILDPRTGLGLTNRIGVTIVAPNASVTDAYDTTINIMGVERGMKLVESLSNVSAFIVTIEGGSTNYFESQRFKAVHKVE